MNTPLWRTALKLPLLFGLVLVHVPLTVCALLCVGLRRRAVGPARFSIVVPFEPGTSSGGAKAVNDFIALLRERVTCDVFIVQDQPPGGWRSLIGQLLSWQMPLAPQCRHLMAGNPALARRVNHGGTIVFEFLATALFMWWGRRPAGVVVLRDHEVLPRKVALEMSQARHVLTVYHALRFVVTYLVCLPVYVRADRVIALTDEDRDWLRRYVPFIAARTSTVPVPFVDDDPMTTAEPVVPPARHLLMVANFFHSPNVDAVRWFLQECAPHLEPGFTLHVCGLDKPLDALDLASAALPVVRHGFVDDVSAAVPHAAIAIAPVVSGGGVRMKNLLLASRRKVVVTTSLGNEGIGFVDGRDAIVTDDGRVMAGRINEVARSAAEIARYGDAARRFVAERFSPAAIRDRLEQEIPSVVGARRLTDMRHKNVKREPQNTEAREM
jgi:hypothetical protein